MGQEQGEGRMDSPWGPWLPGLHRPCCVPAPGRPDSSPQAGSGRETGVWLVLAQTVTLSFSYSLFHQMDSLS